MLFELKRVAAVVALGWAGLNLPAAGLPGVERLLPEDTVALVTAPDFPRLKTILQQSPQSRFWAAPEMKPFRDKFLARGKEEFLVPLERELKVDLASWLGLLEGQVSLALAPNGSPRQDDEPLAFVLLADTKGQSGQLKTNLTELRRKWAEAGKTVRTETIRGRECTILQVSSNDLPATLRRFLPRTLELQELGAENRPPNRPTENQLVIGQVESLLIVANSLRLAEKIVIRLTGGALPPLGELAGYQASHQAMFRDAPLYGWVNFKVFVDRLSYQAAQAPTSTAPSPVEEIKPQKLLTAAGFSGVKTIAFNLQSADEGMRLQVAVAVPEASRQGVFKILAGDPKGSSPPPFVPADAVKFQRWRIDLKQGFATLEKTLNEISPQSLNGLKAILNTAQDAARLSDPSLDLKTILSGALGDDLIRYQKAPRGPTPVELDSPPTLTLVGSPNPGHLATGLQWLLVVLSGKPVERDFLGRKIFSVPMPPLHLLWGGAASPGPQPTLHFAATSSYLAMSTDVSLLEEHLRSAESQAKPLRETPGLAEAAERVQGASTSMFGYSSQAESLRMQFEAWRANPVTLSNRFTGLGAVPVAVGMTTPERSYQEWMDPTLLPPFDQVARYFHFTVYSGSASADGLTFKLFAPAPPTLRSPGGVGGIDGGLRPK